MSDKKAIFPGSFDPITLGHTAIISRALEIFDKIIIAVGENKQKEYYFTLKERMIFLQKKYENNPKIKITSYGGLTIDLCKKMNINTLIRGLRNSRDFEFEQSIAQINKDLGIDTIFLVSSPNHSHISSSLVRELLQNGHTAHQYRP